MKYNVFVYATYNEFEHDPDSWLDGPDDDFIPAEYNTVYGSVEHHYNVDWTDVMNVSDSYVTCPGFDVGWISIDVEPHVEHVQCA